MNVTSGEQSRAALHLDIDPDGTIRQAGVPVREGPAGPAAKPCVCGGRMFTLDDEGDLCCIYCGRTRLLTLPWGFTPRRSSRRERLSLGPKGVSGRSPAPSRFDDALAGVEAGSAQGLAPCGDAEGGPIDLARRRQA